jgi:exodeoxyribonuclease V alpha subunit
VTVADPGGEMVVEGIVERVVFVDRSGFTVLLLGTGEQEPLKASGEILQGAQPGESLRLTGTWRQHPAHGTQFAATDCTHTLPASLYAMRRYLASGLIKGIGPKLADAIVAEFAEQTMHVLEETPQRLLEVHQIGPGRHARIIEAWKIHQDIRELMLLLHGAGVPAGHAPRICHHFATETTNTADLVHRHPYRLTEVRGLGFHYADAVAQWLGIPQQSPQRLRAGLLHALDRSALQGHCYLPEDRLLREAAALLDQDQGLLPRELDALRAAGHLLVELQPHLGRESALVFSRRLHAAETSLAKHLARLHNAAPTALSRRGEWTDTALPLPAGAPDLHPAQEQAVRMALTQPVSVLTGGPGCGKSFTVATIVDVAEAAGAQVSLAAPTGRAAKRLSELTGNRATTVHRLLQPGPATGDSLFDQDPMEADLFVIDEASMLDLPLCERLLEKIPTGAHILFVGDTDQLPSIGPGTVLADLLRVPAIARTALRHVFRQGHGSAITANAHRIIAGEPPLNGGDFWYLRENNPDKIPDLVLDLVTRRLPQAYGVAPGDIHTPPAPTSSACASRTPSTPPATVTPNTGATPAPSGWATASCPPATIPREARTASSTAPPPPSSPWTPNNANWRLPWTTETPRPTSSTNSTTSCTPTPSPSTAPRAANTPSSSSRSPPPAPSYCAATSSTPPSPAARAKSSSSARTKPCAAP